MKIHYCKQGSPEWDWLRLGSVTSSNFNKAIAAGQGKTRDAYMNQLLSERLTLIKTDSYKNDDMQWGTDHEKEARAYYQFQTANKIDEVGYVEYTENIGCSPDGLIGDYGMVEFKCPKSSTFISYLLDNQAGPKTYKHQIQGGLWIADRDWCDFVAYDPRQLGQKLLIVKVERDEEYIEKLSTGIEEFEKELLSFQGSLDPEFLTRQLQCSQLK